MIISTGAHKLDLRTLWEICGLRGSFCGILIFDDAHRFVSLGNCTFCVNFVTLSLCLIGKIKLQNKDVKK